MSQLNDSAVRRIEIGGCDGSTAMHISLLGIVTWMLILAIFVAYMKLFKIPYKNKVHREAN